MMRTPAEFIERYVRGLESGLLSLPEVVSATLNVLGHSADLDGLWERIPPAVQVTIRAYLKDVDVDAAVASAEFYIGPGEPDPERRVAQIVAAESLYLNRTAYQLLLI